MGLFDGMSDGVYYASASMDSLFVYCELGLIARLAGSVASVGDLDLAGSARAGKVPAGAAKAQVSEI